jgi:ankyrin repeat protein
MARARPRLRPPVVLAVLLGLLTSPGPAAAQQSPLDLAIRQDDPEAVRKLVAADPTLLRTETQNGELPLHVAVQLGRERIAELLLNAGADVNARDRLGRTPLQVALSYRQRSLAEVLLRRKADIQAGKEGGGALLCAAADQGFGEVVRLLLARKADVHYKGRAGYQPLHAAAEGGHLEAVRLLIAAGADVNHQTPARARFIGGIDRVYNGMQTPLLLAASGGHVEIARLLLAKKAKVEVRDQFGLSPLQHAARVGNAELVQLLLDQRARVNLEPRKGPRPRGPAELLSGWPDLGGGHSALHLAAEGGHAEAVGLLLKHKADVNARDDRGRTPLHRVVDDTEEGKVLGARELMMGYHSTTRPSERLRTGQRERTLALLLAARADVHAADGAGHTPLYYALKNAGSSELPVILVRKGAELNLLDAALLGHVGRLEQLLEAAPAKAAEKVPPGQTALHATAEAGQLRSAELLLRYGAKVNVPDHFGRTPLFRAVDGNHPELVKLLLDKGADVSPKDKSGVSPAHQAVIHKRAKVLEQLLTRRNDLDAPSYRVLLSVAANVEDPSGNRPMLRLLLDRRGKLTLKDDFGVSLLADAANMGRTDVVRLLLGYGAAVDGSAEVRMTPLTAAASRGLLPLMELLLEHKANVNARCKGTGWTPLHYAAMGRQAGAVRLLLARGANPAARDALGRTPLEVSGGQGEAAELLRQGAKK